MRNIRHLLLHIFLASLLSGSAFAETVVNLYEAEAPVVGQEAEARANGIREAFKKVLVKVSGNRALASSSKTAGLAKNANQFVQQYRYRLLAPTQTGAAEPPAEGQPDMLLWVNFDERSVNQVLRQNDIPVWSRTRPSVLLWLGADQAGRRQLYQADGEQDLQAAIDRVSEERGLPFLLPIMDIEDRSSLQASDLWGGFEEPIRRASSRYAPDIILTVRMNSLDASHWVADYSLYQPVGSENWQLRGASEQELVAEGLQQMVDRLAAGFAPQTVTHGMHKYRIKVSGLKRLADYIMVKEYLLSLAMIEQIDILTAEPYEVSFLAQVQASRDALEKSIMLGGVLEPSGSQDGMAKPGPGPTSPAQYEGESLSYRLR